MPTTILTESSPMTTPSPPFSHSAAPGFMAVARTLMLRNLIKAHRAPIGMTFSLLQPIVWLVLFSQTFARLGDTEQFRTLGYTSYLGFFTGSMVAFTMLFSALSSGLSMIADLDTGMLDKLMTSPVNSSAILLGRVLADGILMFAQGAIVLTVAWLMGATISTGPAGALAILVLATAFGVAWAALSNAIALFSGSSEVTMSAGLLCTLPVLFLSSAFFPEQLLPGWLRTVAHWNPAGQVIESIRSLMVGPASGGVLLRTVLLLAFVGVLTGAAAARGFRQVAK